VFSYFLNTFTHEKVTILKPSFYFHQGRSEGDLPECCLGCVQLNCLPVLQAVDEAALFGPLDTTTTEATADSPNSGGLDSLAEERAEQGNSNGEEGGAGGSGAAADASSSERNGANTSAGAAGSAIMGDPSELAERRQARNTG
jgi:hypothetical protein